MWPLALLLSPAYVTHAGPCAPRLAARAAGLSRVAMGYVPDGLTAEEYKKIKEREKAQKNLGASGTNRFQSRSMYAFQKALESGEAAHLFPVDPKKVKAGAIKLEDVPYMQRRDGRWDQSDVKGAAKRKWSRWDKAYENGGRAQSTSVSIFGGASLPWTSAALAERAAAGPDKELVKQWKAMGIKVDKDGNPITAASKRGPKQAEPAAQKKGKGLFGLF
ncbi:hypothetical protein KFE25_008055 [Diacronema lutheri]|uniref:Uncharacterized protein n=1 Tax=Diacronema lutheri TaxID=2081491 RepID=A0A8J5XDF9_DIALT|nr:hypothetical protein KFE25_008055 [Diacronema lutheri]|mmetsp:Transcript_4868/g.15080  ORF Transcript_4868/g.15080 Transcript_4868/m.15080 type:complete len:219 (+) Transcript_4868:30-686(+)